MYKHNRSANRQQAIGLYKPSPKEVEDNIVI